MKSNRQPVMIDAALYKRLQEYSQATGIPIARVVARGLDDWLDTVGAARLAMLKKESAE
jgi:hypothetical protein